MDLLKFQRGNTKLPDYLLFSLRSGHECPFAYLCHTRVYPDKPSGEKIRHFAIEQGLEGAFGCFSAGDELVHPKVYEARLHNVLLLQKAANLVPSRDLFNRATMMCELLYESIRHADPKNKHPRCRVHVGGDFFSYEYMWAWLRVAERMPNREFYAYTKSLPFWLRHHFENHFPATENFKMTASAGGRADAVIDLFPDVFKRVSHVVADPADSKHPIEHGEDEFCFQESGHFDLILHGHQPAGTDQSRQVYQNKKNGWGYSRENLTNRREQVKQLVELHV